MVAPRFDLMAWTADRYAGEARPIAMALQGTDPARHPGADCRHGRLGKSYSRLIWLCRSRPASPASNSRKLILGGRIAVEGTAVVITAEDSFDAVHRRLNRIDPTSRAAAPSQTPDRVAAAGCRRCRRPLIASDGKALARRPFLEELKRQLAGDQGAASHRDRPAAGLRPGRRQCRSGRGAVPVVGHGGDRVAPPAPRCCSPITCARTE